MNNIGVRIARAVSVEEMMALWSCNRT